MYALRRTGPWRHRSAFTVIQFTQYLSRRSMRLLNANTIQLEEFSDDKVPPYAILSHTWEQNEVSFQDIQDVHSGLASQKEGYVKIQHACRQALSDDLRYVWVDTCCIDKKSSSELSEAINSMFDWYEEARICYAYLVDVEVQDSIRRSRWFTRGWTLQELLAPRDVRFFGRTWNFLGTKRSLSDTISEATGIDGNYLNGEPLLQASIAKRMSWASRRVTTRKEDIAYSLLGIFDVNMPMLYGEGEKAFLRLQEEIIKDSDDQSLYAWRSVREPVAHQTDRRGILARSPADFKDVGNVIPCKVWNTAFPPSMTSKGLRIELPVYYPPEDHVKSRPYAILLCHTEDDMFNLVALPLRSLYGTSDEFSRRGWRSPMTVPEKEAKALELETIYIKKSPRYLQPLHGQPDRYESFLIRRMPTVDDEHGYHLSECSPATNWDASRCIITTSSNARRQSLKALLEFTSDCQPGFVVVLEYDARKIYNRKRFSPSQASVYITSKLEDKCSESIHSEDTTSKSINSGVQSATLVIDDKTITASIVKQEVMGVEMYVVDIDISTKDQMIEYIWGTESSHTRQE